MMTRAQASGEANCEKLISEVVARAQADERVDRALPWGGRLHLDRRLPFLCVHRQPASLPDRGTARLISPEAANLTTTGRPRFHRPVAALVRRLAETQAAHFGGFLVFELWAGPDKEAVGSLHAQSGEPIPPAPAFKIVTCAAAVPQGTVERLARSLERIKVFGQPAEVSVVTQGQVHAPGLKPLLRAAEAGRLGAYLVGLEVRPVYRSPQTGQVFPAVLRLLRRRLGRALKQAFFTFALEHTQIRPQHYYSLGRRTVAKVVWEVDRRLAELDKCFDLLLQATPVNVEAEWYAFRRNRYDKAPAYHYRPLAHEPTLLKRRLYEIPLERIDDPTLAYILREKQDELDRRITMLCDIGTPRFLAGSRQVFGSVQPELLALAETLLARISPRVRDGSAGPQVDAAAVARRAEEEIAHYRRQHPGFTATVALRDDLYAGLLSSRGQLLIGRKTTVPLGRVDALVQHEVGAHLLTYYNGRCQPFRLLEAGLAGYDRLQEGLAVLAEHLVGGLNRARLRVLAGRVVAVEQLVQGACFLDTFRVLVERYGFSRRVAYTMTMRVHRAGGLTKDAVYLRGLVEILEYLRQGGEIGPLLVGKIAADHVPLIRELELRGVLSVAPFRPRCLDHPLSAGKLERLRRGLAVTQLVEVSSHESGIRGQ